LAWAKLLKFNTRKASFNPSYYLKMRGVNASFFDAFNLAVWRMTLCGAMVYG
jgi:hypothetical protein